MVDRKKVRQIIIGLIPWVSGILLMIFAEEVFNFTWFAGIILHIGGLFYLMSLNSNKAVKTTDFDCISCKTMIVPNKEGDWHCPKCGVIYKYHYQLEKLIPKNLFKEEQNGTYK